MDERLRRDNSDKKESINSNSAHGRDFQQVNYSENINSNAGGDKINPSMQKIKRFEVHIPESEIFPANKVDAPTRVPAPVRRPVSNATQLPGNPAAASKAPVRPRPANGQVPKRPMPPGGIRPTPPSGAKPPVRGANTAPSANGKPAETSKKQVDSAAKKPEKKTAKRKKIKADFAYNFAKNTLIICVCLIFIATLTTVVSSVAFGFINDILVIDDKDKDYSVVIEIPEGADYAAIFDILKENGLVNQPLLTDFFLKFRHYDYQAAYDDETGELLYDENGDVMQEAVRYAPGVYYVYADSGIENILDSMLVNNNLNKGTVRLTFPEGFTIAEVFERIEKNGVCEAEKLYANLEIVGDKYSFIKNIKDTEGCYLKAEGYLFPDTYDFYIGESASSVIEKLFNNFEVRWEKEYDARLKELGMSINDIIKIASIIQSEANNGSEMPEISGIIYNRLENSATYPTLGMDSTSDYIDLMLSMGAITKEQSDFYRPFYSTYESTGFPPAPICNPGASAIKAALYPAENDYYFFCHGNDGQIYYARNIIEHEENEKIAIYGSVGGN